MDKPLAATDANARGIVMDSLADTGMMFMGVKKAASDLIEWQDAEIERLRGGPPFIYDTCADCGRALIRVNGPETWMCPACCHARMVKAETRVAELEGTLQQWDIAPRIAVDVQQSCALSGCPFAVVAEPDDEPDATCALDQHGTACGRSKIPEWCRLRYGLVIVHPINEPKDGGNS